ncbi:hypothetical protein ANRL4_03188 [Anaerolineae bacterium]|nr:hypothetical protein ANRL4_03188 [Anaerolineae bacterium]
MHLKIETPLTPAASRFQGKEIKTLLVYGEGYGVGAFWGQCVTSASVLDVKRRTKDHA